MKYVPTSSQAYWMNKRNGPSMHAPHAGGRERRPVKATYEIKWSSLMFDGIDLFSSCIKHNSLISQGKSGDFLEIQYFGLWEVIN